MPATETPGTKNAAPTTTDNFGEPVKWFVIRTNEEEAQYDTLRRIPIEGVDQLYKIDAADKAKAVPYIRIWRVNRDSNRSRGPEISSQFIQTPDFGKSLGTRFGERPGLSLESVTIKSVNPGGFIIYRELDIVIKVHRPDALFNTLSDESNVLASLLTPGHTHVLRYGWQGGRNPMLSTGIWDLEKYPELNDSERAQVDRAIAQGETPPKFYKDVAPAKNDVRFVTTNYNFTITPDNQIEITIKAFEDGELNTRDAVFLEQRDNPKPPVDVEKGNDWLQKIIDGMLTKLSGASEPGTIEIKKDPGSNQTEKQPEQFVKFSDVLGILFSDPLALNFNALGYKHKHFFTCKFNKNAPKTSAAYGSQDLADSAIGDFKFRYRDLQEVLNRVIASKGQITVYNMLKQFFAVLSNPGIYEDTKPLGVSVPEMHIVPVYNPDHEGRVNLFVIDRKRYLTRFNNTINEHNLAEQKDALNKPGLGKALRAKGIPLIELYKGNSFIQDAKFNVVNDEQMKSILMLKSLPLSRREITAGNQNRLQISGGAVESSLLYRSAIKGEITTLGNFVFNIMGLVWIAFGIRAWDGFFYVLQKVDKVSREGFTTTVTLQAEGSNPVGTNASPSTSGPSWVKDKILQRKREYDYEMWKFNKGYSDKPPSSE